MSISNNSFYSTDNIKTQNFFNLSRFGKIKQFIENCQFGECCGLSFIDDNVLDILIHGNTQVALFPVYKFDDITTTVDELCISEIQLALIQGKMVILYDGMDFTLNKLRGNIF
jgi:hypothetical protein